MHLSYEGKKERDDDLRETQLHAGSNLSHTHTHTHTHTQTHTHTLMVPCRGMKEIARNTNPLACCNCKACCLSDERLTSGKAMEKKERPFAATVGATTTGLMSLRGGEGRGGECGRSRKE